MGALEDLREIEAVSVEEGAGKQRDGYGESDAVEVTLGGEAVLADFVDVEGELSTDMLVRAFRVVDVAAVLQGELGELLGYGEVDRVGMADGIAQIVGEGADGEGDIVGIFRVAKERADEVAGADVVEEVGEVGFPKGIIAEVLDYAPAVGVGMGFAELCWCEGGEAPEQERLNRVGPSEVDDLLMGEDGICASRWRGVSANR